MLHRAKSHRASLRKGKHPSPSLQHLYDLCGEQAFELIEHATDAPQLLGEENKLIRYWRERVKLLNEQCSPEWKAAVSARVKAQHAEKKFGRATWDEASHARQAAAMVGLPNAMKGKKYGPEHGQKIAAKLKGKPKSPEHIRAVQEARARTFTARKESKCAASK